MPQAERYLNVSPVREVYSAPHSRSCSFKTYRRPQDLDLWDSRPRTNSLPTCPSRTRQRHASDSSARDRERDPEKLCRVRYVILFIPQLSFLCNRCFIWFFFLPSILPLMHFCIPSFFYFIFYVTYFSLFIIFSIFLYLIY